MRVNVYAEEIPVDPRIELVEKSVEGLTFYGLRIFLAFPGQPWWVHRKVSGELDDDSSAVTIWGTRDSLHRLIDALGHTFALHEAAGSIK